MLIYQNAIGYNFGTKSERQILIDPSFYLTIRKLKKKYILMGGVVNQS